MVFGNLVNKFGTYQDSPDELVSKLNPVVLDFVYVGVATAFASYMEIYLFMLTSESASEPFTPTPMSPACGSVATCDGVPPMAVLFIRWHSKNARMCKTSSCVALQASGRPIGCGRGIWAASCGRRLASLTPLRPRASCCRSVIVVMASRAACRDRC